MTAAQPDLDLARDLFARLGRIGHDGVGITRDSYGRGEQEAHDLIRREAEALGLRTRTDAALNLYLTLPGRDPEAPVAMAGSHLDSVPRGGNFDGTAGVLAGMAVLAGWRRAGFVPPADTTVMAIRAEESAWFPASYIGSKAAFGVLPAEALEVSRRDTGQTLSHHIAALGGEPDIVASGEPALDPRRLSRFVEVHIEQGPTLIDTGQPVGLVTGIRGSFRYRRARVHGAYAHSGATPRDARRDAVLAAARLVTAMDDAWQRLAAEGRDLTVTFGRLSTDPVEADFSKVAGRADFCIDVRSFEPETLAAVEEELHATVARIADQGGVRFDLGARTSSHPARMDPALRAAIHAEAEAMGTPLPDMPCGAGHDAALFAQQGVPSAMIFVRNANGSHNPEEHMDFDDFAIATRLLGRTLALPPGINGTMA